MADADGTARFLIGVQVDVTAVEEALPEGLKATTAGPQVPALNVCLLDIAQGTAYWTSRAAKQALNASNPESTLPADHSVLLYSANMEQHSLLGKCTLLGIFVLQPDRASSHVLNFCVLVSTVRTATAF